MLSLDNQELIKHLITKHLKPMVTLIDNDSVYPKDFLGVLGDAGLFSVSNKSHLGLIQEAARVCASTAFIIWCHTTAISYVNNGKSQYLKNEVLPQLLSGQLLGGTGLSNPMKFYAGMEPLRLKAKKISNGYRISGRLPFVSNLGQGHWFGIVAEVNSSQRMMAFVPCNAQGLTLIERTDFLGLNGTGTYNCCFEEVLVPNEYVLADDADGLVRMIRSNFVLNQAGMAFGLIQSAIDGMRKVQEKQGGANQYLKQQPDELEQRWKSLHDRAYRLAHNYSDSQEHFQEILRVRLAGAYLSIEAAHAGMLHSGGAGYIKTSHASRRLREAYFIAVVTPAIKQLEKLLQIN